MKTKFVELLRDKYGDELPSQEEIARDLKLSQSTVSRWITGQTPNRFDRETVEAICAGLGVQPGQLFYIESEES